jgi:hypothetical protein
MIAIVEGSNNEFIDFDDPGFAYFLDPPSDWANPTDCGNFPCTAPSNVLVKMQGTTFSGSVPALSTQVGSNF